MVKRLAVPAAETPRLADVVGSRFFEAAGSRVLEVDGSRYFEEGAVPRFTCKSLDGRAILVGTAGAVVWG